MIRQQPSSTILPYTTLFRSKIKYTLILVNQRRRYIRTCFFKFFDIFLQTQQVIDIIVSFYEAHLFVIIDLEIDLFAVRQDLYILLRKIDSDFRFGIFTDRS